MNSWLQAGLGKQSECSLAAGHEWLFVYMSKCKTSEVATYKQKACQLSQHKAPTRLLTSNSPHWNLLFQSLKYLSNQICIVTNHPLGRLMQVVVL